MTQSPGPSVLPNFIKAGSPLGLRRLMLMNNLKLGGYVSYFQITAVQESGKTVWYAWFNAYSEDTLIVEKGAK